MNQLDHELHMRRAIALTANAPTRPFAAVIVHGGSGETLAEGWNRSDISPTRHAEVEALNALFRGGNEGDGRELMLYSTAEPCPMCMAALYWGRIGAVVFGSSIRFLQERGWRQIDICAEEIIRRSPGWNCTLVGGVLEEECNALFEAGPKR